jgi:hypothetical protein
MRRFLARAQQREEGNALIFALLVLFVCVSIAAVMAALALTNSISSKNLNASLAYQSATDTALANALQVANTPAPNGGYNVLYAHQSKATAVTGQIAAASSTYPVKWRWYTTRVAASGGQASSWYIFADAYQSSPSEYNARHVRQIFDPLVTTQATNANDGVTYQGDLGSAFQYGMLGTESVTLADNTHVYSYDSTNVAVPGSSSNNAQAATNKTLTLGANTSLNVFQAFRGASCTPAQNCPPNGNVQQYNVPFNLNLNGITQKVAASCPNDPSTYASWTASSGAALINGGCYNNLVFDANVNVLNQTRVYVKGNIAVNPGVQVNYQGSPENLQLYSQVGSSALFNNGSSASPTYFNGVVAGASLVCKDTATSGSNPSTLFIYGNQLSFGPATTLWLDDAASNSTPSLNVSTVYQPVQYEVYSK